LLEIQHKSAIIRNGRDSLMTRKTEKVRRRPLGQPQVMTFSVVEAGKILGVGRSLAFASARDGSLPTIRIGKRLLVPRPALEKLLGGAIGGGGDD